MKKTALVGRKIASHWVSERKSLIKAIHRQLFHIAALMVTIGLAVSFVGPFSGQIDASVRTAGAGQMYRLTDLGVVNGQGGQMISFPEGINNAGQVTGNSRSGTSIHAVRFSNGIVEDLGTISGGSNSIGVGINNLGHVAGDSEYSQNGGSIRHATLFRNGTATDLGTLPTWGNYSRGNGINDFGVVVGHSGTSLSTSNTRAFIWDAANGMRDLGTIGGAYSKAFSINNSGVVTGTSQSGVPFGGYRAFIWDAANGMRDIGTIAGTYSSGAYINDNGHVAGTSSISGDNREHAFLYDGTTMRDLGSLGSNDFLSDRSTAYGINIHDHVVGSTYRPYTGGALYAIPFIYRDGQMFDLETLVDASLGNYRLYTATGINDSGQIAVDALLIGTPNQRRAVLLTPINRTGLDFDGDGRADVSVFRSSNSTWYLNNSQAGFSATQFGLSSDKLVPADYDGDGKTDVGVYRDGSWYLLRSQAGFTGVTFGAIDDIPVPADYDGDGKSELAVFRPSNGTWYFYNLATNQTNSFSFGQTGDNPVVADYDGDGKADVAVFRNGTWYLQRSTLGFTGVSFGESTDKPTPADYDGDGKADIAVFRPSNGTWYLQRSQAGFTVHLFGLGTDIPAPADYDGDGKTDIAVFRGGTWYLQRSQAGFTSIQFGAAGDVPVPSRQIP